MSSDTNENILILQGGGSLGAFGCGVFKALTNKLVYSLHLLSNISLIFSLFCKFISRVCNMTLVVLCIIKLGNKCS
jgi:hypothetical protein